MKHVKRILAFALTLFMAFGFTLSAYAEDTPATGTITIKGLEAGDTVRYYRVIEWKDDVSGWAFVSPFAEALTENQQKEIIGFVKENPNGTNEIVKGKITDTTATKMGAKAANATALNVTDENPNGDTVAEGATSWSAYNLKPGLYMAVITGATPDAEDHETMHVYNPVFLAVQANNAGSELNLPLNYADSGTAKKSDITVDKKAKSADKDSWEDATTEDVGDIIDFKVETTVPAYLESWSNPVFIVTDTMSEGLTLAVGEKDALTDITVVGEDNRPLTAHSDSDPNSPYDYTITEKSATGYTIAFSDSYLKGRTAAELVTITYQAKITSKAKNVNPETNTVRIDYSRNPNVADDHGTKEDKTTHYTFSIDAGLFGDDKYETSELIKVGVDAAGNPVTVKKTYSNGSEHNPLQGAEFKLYTDAACTISYTNGTITEDTVFKTDENGKLNITGLDEGTYYLKETKAATGYMLLTQVVSYTIEAQYTDVAATETCNAYKELSGYTVRVNGGPTSTYTFENGTITKTDEGHAGDQSYEIKNTQGQSLPSTGGIGTTIFYIVGGVMVAGAVVFLLTKRRVAGAEE